MLVVQALSQVEETHSLENKLVFGDVVMTETQYKVADNKYLKGDRPDAWLKGVAHNIALTEVLYSGIPDDVLFKDVAYRRVAGSGGAGDKLLFHEEALMKQKEKLASLEKELHVHPDDESLRSLYIEEKEKTPDKVMNENFKVLLRNLEGFAESHPIAKERVSKAEERFYNLMKNWNFLPNSPTLMNAGRDLQQLSACYVLPVQDSVYGWMKTAEDAAMIHKSGGGTGFAVSRVRPTNDQVMTTKGIASGPLSPLKIINQMTEEIKQGGQRRGANMGILHYTHPNIEDFVRLKAEHPGTLENFNVSVALDEKFWEAVKEGKEYELINPKTKKVSGKKNARELFNLIIQGAWASGDPGYVMIDRINNSTSNPTPLLGQIESTNPCGEQPLLPYEPCNLGSINLSNFVKDGKVDYSSLEQIVRDSILFLDSVIDINNYPLAEIEDIAKGNRRIGLGVMGWAEMLARLEIPYESEKAVELGEQVMEFINTISLQASEKLAEERGVFPNYKNSIYDKAGKFFRGKEAWPRNCARTTIAPTGTISIAAGLQGGGIEPFFRLVYKRMQAEAIDAAKKGLKADDKYVYYEVVSMFEDYCQKHDWFGFEREELLDLVEKNKGSLTGIKGIPRQARELFRTADDIHWKTHIDHQAAFQRHTDNGVSKTINMAHEVTPEEIGRAYLYAYEKGVKGLTVYRDGSKGVQVLSAPTKEDLGERVRGEELPGFTKKVVTPHGTAFFTLNYDAIGLRETFINVGKAGSDVQAFAEALGRSVSDELAYNLDVEKIIERFEGIGGRESIGFGENKILSLVDAFGKALRTGKGKENVFTKLYLEYFKEKKEQEKVDVAHLLFGGESQQQELKIEKSKTNGKANGSNGKVKRSGDACRNCGSFTVGLVGGCATCLSCGTSKC